MSLITTKEQRQQLVEKIIELAKLHPDKSKYDIFKDATSALALEMKYSDVQALKYWRKAFGGEKQTKQPSSNQPLSPEAAIAFHEKQIQEHVKELHGRRDQLMQQVLHLDNVIAKYKAPRISGKFNDEITNQHNES